MPFADLFGIAGAAKSWTVPQDFEAYFKREFAPERSKLLALYERGKVHAVER